MKNYFKYFNIAIDSLLFLKTTTSYFVRFGKMHAVYNKLLGKLARERRSWQTALWKHK